MSEFYFEGTRRLDLGLGNPNKAAVLIACLMAASWVLAWVWRRGFWASLAIFGALGVALVWTFSRGGVVAAAAGMAPVLWWMRPRMTAVRWVALGLVGAGLIAFAVGTRASSRFVRGLAQEDLSVENRLKVWSAAPAMMADAPGGWGLGNAGRAYINWYQPLDFEEEYRTMVNSHLTWLVELGWPARFAYVFGWLVALILCLPPRAGGWRSVALGAWVAFAVGAWFSSVAECPWVWVCPSILLVAVIVERFWRAQWTGMRASLAWGAGLSAVLLLVTGAWGTFAERGVTRGGRDQVVWGNGQPRAWVLWDEPTLGRYAGKTLRRSQDAEPAGEGAGAGGTALGFARSVDDLPAGGDIVLVTGGGLAGTTPEQLREILPRCRSLVLFNPSFPPASVGWDNGVPANVTVIIGDFSQSPTHAQWRAMGAAGTRVLPGVADYVPRWPQISVELLSRHDS